MGCKSSRSVCASATAPPCPRCLRLRTTRGCRTATWVQTPAAWAPTAPLLRCTPAVTLSVVERLQDVVFNACVSCAGESGAAAAGQRVGPSEDGGRDEAGGNSLCWQVSFFSIWPAAVLVFPVSCFLCSRVPGVLYAGLMLTKQGPKVLEFNCRFGDPECQVCFSNSPLSASSHMNILNTHRPSLFQVLLPLLKSDLYDVILNTMSGKLASSAPVWHQDSSAVTVVMASAGYPGSYKKGVEITGTEDAHTKETLPLLIRDVFFRGMLLILFKY